MKQQFIGPIPLRGMNLTIDGMARNIIATYIILKLLMMVFHFFSELEFLLGKAGAVPTSIKKDPRPKVEDKMMASLGVRNRTKDSDTEEED